jgi:hypothetical protein
MATRPRTYLTLENYMYMERQLWQDDGHEYIHDGYRVFISAKLKCHVFTSARVGEISEGSTRRGTGKGLRYKVSIMVNYRGPGLMLIIIGHGNAGRMEGWRARIALQSQERICERNA